MTGHIDLSGEWSGWRVRGRWLVSPEGDRINPERLRGILFREANEKRRHKAGLKSGQQGAAVITLASITRKRSRPPDASE